MQGSFRFSDVMHNVENRFANIKGAEAGGMPVVHYGECLMAIHMTRLLGWFDFMHVE